MNYQELLQIYPAHHVIEVNKEFCISDLRIEKIRRILARVEIRTTLYGEKVKVYHEMAFNQKGEIIPRYFGPPIRKHNRNWLACFCIPVLLVYYQTDLPSLLDRQIKDWRNAPFSDESHIVIPDPIEELFVLNEPQPTVTNDKASWRNRDKAVPLKHSDWNNHWRSRDGSMRRKPGKITTPKNHKDSQKSKSENKQPNRK